MLIFPKISKFSLAPELNLEKKFGHTNSHRPSTARGVIFPPKFRNGGGGVTFHQIPNFSMEFGEKI